MIVLGGSSESCFRIRRGDERHIARIGGNGDGGLGVGADGNRGIADEFGELIELQEIGDRRGIRGGVNGDVVAATLRGEGDGQDANADGGPIFRGGVAKEQVHRAVLRLWIGVLI